MKTELHTLEWSRDQDCFHIDTLPRTLKKNFEVALLTHKYNGDWKIIGIYSSSGEAQMARRIIEGKMTHERTNPLCGMVLE